MAKVFIEETTLSAIGDAIRTKTETTELINPADMAEKIEGISVGSAAVVEPLSITANGTYNAPEGIDGYTPITVNVPQDGGPPAEAFIITGICDYRFANNGWDWFVNQYGNQITTENISSAKYMFYMIKSEQLPFNINFTDNSGVNCEQMFGNATFKSLTDENIRGMNGKIGNANSMFSFCSMEKIPSLTFDNSKYYSCGNLFGYAYEVKEIGDLVNLHPDGIGSLFLNCHSLKVPPRLINPKWDRMISYKYAGSTSMFKQCYSLRSIPEDYFNNWFKKPNEIANPTYMPYYYMFQDCWVLDEIINLSFFMEEDAIIASNMFNNTFLRCCRLKNIIFTTNEDGTSKVMKWKSQTIDLTNQLGFATDDSLIREITRYNSDMTEATKIVDDATYQQLKDNPDSWTTDINYSRYNRTSAIETINSLPDTSAYLAEKGGTNTIKFKGASGALTDGGAINTMTEEEIAVAAAKGWTVSFV